MSRILGSVAAACLLTAVVIAAQSSALVEIDVIVTDKSGQLVSDLSQEEAPCKGR